MAFVPAIQIHPIIVSLKLLFLLVMESAFGKLLVRNTPKLKINCKFILGNERRIRFWRIIRRALLRRPSQLSTIWLLQKGPL